ncbi:uncharacterized protein LOC111808367 isoform X1 [Cucurbita pepo subsp. pepo]|uniref:uncharacterized protein LOC111808367 isoform X1 n=1 Tax=Cucurbita pepo subsp. pepo TaxID=3664 RepID=UPI000C9D3AFE|nr:uncharacterized protein LOC111808367 isoform X1 [Cucurbita pepo subsp. pepo]
MPNLFALCLVITSLTAAGLWSPSPASRQDHEQDVIVKEGHRVVVVEYGDQGQHNTKVSISSEPTKDASPSNPLHDSLNIGIPNEDSERHRTRDLICDALGKCKHKIASAVGKAKVMVSETAQEAHDVGEAVAGAFDEAKETVSDKSHHVGTSFSEKGHRLRESVEKAREDADEFLEKTKETVLEKARDLKEGAKDVLKEGKARDLKEGAKDVLKEGKARDLKEGAMEKGREARQTAEKIKTGGNKVKENLMGIPDGGLKLVNDSFRYLRSLESWKAAMDVLSLLGFGMALGMGVWTTFISSYVLASALPRQQLAVVQSKIYPLYFRAMASSIGMALFGHLFSRTKWMFPIPKNAEVVQGYVLVAALLMIFANSLYMEPQATKVMFERLKVEKEEGKGIEDIAAEPRDANDNPPAVTTSTATQVVEREAVKSRIVGLNKRLKKLNSYSSLLNLLTLMALTWHLVYLSQRLCIPC